MDEIRLPNHHDKVIGRITLQRMNTIGKTMDVVRFRERWISPRSLASMPRSWLAPAAVLSLSRFWVLLQEPRATFASTRHGSSIETLVCAASGHSVCILYRSSLPPSQWAKESGIREDMEVKAVIDICGCFGPPGSLHAIQGLMLLSSPALSPLQIFPSMK
jgi:hypothetical protein